VSVLGSNPRRKRDGRAILNPDGRGVVYVKGPFGRCSRGGGHHPPNGTRGTEGSSGVTKAVYDGRFADSRTTSSKRSSRRNVERPFPPGLTIRTTGTTRTRPPRKHQTNNPGPAGGARSPTELRRTINGICALSRLQVGLSLPFVEPGPPFQARALPEGVVCGGLRWGHRSLLIRVSENGYSRPAGRGAGISHRNQCPSQTGTPAAGNRVEFSDTHNTGPFAGGSKRNPPGVSPSLGQRPCPGPRRRGANQGSCSEGPSVPLFRAGRARSRRT